MLVKADAVQIGVIYYPEQWEERMWEPDIQRMQTTGVRVVRLAEFAWSRMEPSPGVYSFGWLDRAIKLFHRYGIQVVLGTPTHTPPRWLTALRPDILPVQSDGSQQQPGVRGHRCYNSPSLREYGLRIVEQMVKRYGAHPAVIGWQIDNEYGVIDCHCQACSAQFRAWAKRTYGSLTKLNAEWGTVVWSGEYSDWSQVSAPHGGSRFHNPSYLLDFTRFQWEAVARFQQLQLDLIRRHCPGHFVTHNFHTYPQRLNLYLIGAGLDVAAFDYYPNTDPAKQATSPYSGALALDVTRGIKRRNFWIMEQLSGSPGCWFPTWRAPYPGFIRAHSWQAIAKGADTVVHFRWRSAPMGAEQFWHGLLDPDDEPGRRFAEFAVLCAEVNKLAHLLQGSSLRHETAILLSHEQLEALRIQPQAEGFDYYENVKDYHRALTKLGIGCDVIEWTAPLHGYKLVIAPSLYLMQPQVAKALEQFAHAGGTVLLTSRSGVKQMNNQSARLPLPGLLAPLAGIRVAEYDPIGMDAHRFTDSRGRSYTGTQWCDILTLHGAEAIASYSEDYYAGSPAVTLHRFGQGQACYVGLHPEEAYLLELLAELADSHGIRRYAKLPPGVQIAERTGPSGTCLFVFNLSRTPQRIELPGSYYSVLYDTMRCAEMELGPYALDILRVEQT